MAPSTTALSALGPGGRRGEAGLVHRCAVRVDADDRVDAGHDLRDVAHVGAAERKHRLDLDADRSATEPHHLRAERRRPARSGVSSRYDGSVSATW